MGDRRQNVRDVALARLRYGIVAVPVATLMVAALVVPDDRPEIDTRRDGINGDIEAMLEEAQQEGDIPLPEAPDTEGVAVSELPVGEAPMFEASDAVVTEAPHVVWPEAASAEVDLDVAPADSADDFTDGLPVPGGRGRERAGSLPVRVGPVPPDVRSRGRAESPARVSVEIPNRGRAKALGVNGLVIEAARADRARGRDAVLADVVIEVDYADFRHAFGGDWASRLVVRAIQECDSSEQAACGGEVLPSTNDVEAGVIAATVPLAANGSPTILAVSGGDDGENGDYKATDLKPAGTWQVSEQTGAFSWSYPLRAVPGLGGPEPSLALSYSSQSIDGQTSNTNSQGSWVGDGWDLWPGYVERRHQSCGSDEDKVDGQDPNNKGVPSGDLCWFSDNATLSLNGSATELVKGSDGVWRGVDDDGARVEQLFLPGPLNGTHNGEYWKVTTPDGTQYFFGRDSMGAIGAPSMDSAWSAPVYGNHPGEPCYKANDFPGSRCTQGWRWNLDFIRDPHGNTLRLYYGRETGAYGREADPDKRTTYHRGGYLRRIEYGTRTQTDAPSARVVFDVADRCLPGESCTQSNPQAWPDVPWDRFCASAPCTEQLSPTFWTQKRLDRIRAQVDRGGSWSTVESWQLRQEYLDAGASDGEGVPMWLSGITRTGHVTAAGGQATSDPEIVFDPGSLPLANRVDGPSDGKTRLNRWRVKRIWTESGGIVNVTYSEPECTRSNTPTPQSNGKRCYPQWYSNSDDDPTLDWFHKYVVDQVTIEDVTGASPRMETHYEYLDSPAWRYDDSELVEKKKRTWSQWRGYSKVRVLEGVASEQQSAVEYLYMRGMHGDRAAPSGGTKSVQITDSQGTSINDHEAHNGFLREVTVRNGPGGEWVEGTIYTPWRHGPTATSGPLKAYMTNTETERTRTKLESGSTRWTRTTTTFDTTYGMPTMVDDRGDESTSADDRCTRYWYARNVGAWMVDRVSRSETVAKRCSQTPDRPADVLSDVRTFYDNPDTHGAAPTRGLPVKVQEVDDWNGSTPVWLTVERSTFDANGRIRDSFDALDRRTRTTYTPTSGGPVTQVSTTNPAGHVTTETLEPAWGLPTRIVDPNNRLTDLTYDGSGRLTQVWLPGRDSGSESPNMKFGYLLRKDRPSAVTSEVLLPVGGVYAKTVSLFDGALRERQVQEHTHGGGRVVTDTVYDSRGQVEWDSQPYYDVSNAPPSTTLVGPGGPQIPGKTEYIRDGAGRLVEEIFYDRGQEAWRTSFAYGGDRTHVTAPEGETATTEIVDARGNVVALRQYHNPEPSGSFDETVYEYTVRDELAKVVDAVGNTWTHVYDQRGRKVGTSDPDLGELSATFDAVGQVVTETDGRGVTLGYTYDALGRRTSVRDGSASGPLRAEWEFDTLPGGVGELARSVRHHDGAEYVSEVLGYDGAGRATGSRVVIPESEAGLSGVYETTSTFLSDGSIDTTTLPAVGGLGAEKLTIGYDDMGAPTWLVSPLQVYVGSVHYSKLGDLTQRRLGEFGRRTVVSSTFDDATRRLLNASVMYERTSGPVEVLDLDYSYDDAGNVTRIADSPGSATPSDTQCFRFDYLRRLTDAWTPLSTAGNNCEASPGPIGGAAPYRLRWTYDETGNRLTQQRFGQGAGTTTYAHPDPGEARPHTVTEAVTTGPSGTSTNTYAYDASGNMVERTIAGSTQTLSWDAEGMVETIDDQAGGYEFVYSAGGDRLIRRDPDGATLYLDGTELRVDYTTGQQSATRYYTHLGTTVAVRTATSLSWMVNDHHETGEVSVDDATMQHQRRRHLPFGETRGAQMPTWPGDKGFVGGTVDPTGLVHLGARLYDQTLGRFISVDPIIDNTDPQQIHGYAYSNNNPLTYTDPDGNWGLPSFVKDAAKAVGSNLAKHADTLDKVAAVASVAGMVPGLGAVATTVALVSAGAAAAGHAYNGDTGKAAMSIAGAIPGGKVLQHTKKFSKAVTQANKKQAAAKRAESDMRQADLRMKQSREARDRLRDFDKHVAPDFSEPRLMNKIRDRLVKESDDASGRLCAAQWNNKRKAFKEAQNEYTRIQRTVNRTSDRLETWKTVDRVYTTYNTVRYSIAPHTSSTAKSTSTSTKRKATGSRTSGGYSSTGDVFIV